MAKAKKGARRLPIEWGYENGRQVVVHAAGRAAIESPSFRFYGLVKVIDQMDACVEAFRKANSLDGEARGILLAMTATVASDLMQEAARDIEAVLVLSPQLRAAVARMEAQRIPTGARLLDKNATGGAA